VNLKTLYIIDGYYFIHKAFSAPIQHQFTAPSGELTTATYIFTTSLLKILREQKPDALIVAMEGGGQSFRRALDENYKVNRSRSSDSFRIQVRRIEEILEAMNIPVLRADGFEADDIIGTIAKKADHARYNVLICSNDKDMLQLVDHNVKIFNTKTGETTDILEVVRKYGISPTQFIDYLALQGDPADNVPGVPGVGSKTAGLWITKYGSIENILEHTGELGKKGQVLSERKDRLLLSKKLVTIDCDVPISFSCDELSVREFNKNKLHQIFEELGFSRLIEQLKLER